MRQLADAYPDYRLVFTGHSLGSALSTIAAVDFYYTHGSADRIQVFAFAPPRIGNDLWALYVNSLPFAPASHRAVKFGDLVPHLPPTFLGYVHVFHQHTIEKDGSIVSCESNPVGSSSECVYNDLFSLNPGLHVPDKYLEYFGQTFSCSH
ncbi:hypothetical protein HDU91_003191 [Kappamyces sp. JEL0680]|nr:hypothetical protein HDU91_003191 [Kappamyces sp. JEL0680]